MRWIDKVECSKCHSHEWSVKNGTWVSPCGKQITTAEIEASR